MPHAMSQLEILCYFVMSESSIGMGVAVSG